MTGQGFVLEVLANLVAGMLLVGMGLLLTRVLFRRSQRRTLYSLGIDPTVTTSVQILLSRIQVGRSKGHDKLDHTFRGSAVSEQEYSAALELKYFIEGHFLSTKIVSLLRSFGYEGSRLTRPTVEVRCWDGNRSFSRGTAVISMGGDIYNSYTAHLCGTVDDVVKWTVVDENGNAVTKDSDRALTKRLPPEWFTDQEPPRVRRIARKGERHPSVWGRDLVEDKTGRKRDLAILQTVDLSNNEGPQSLIVIAGLGAAGTAAGARFLIQHAQDLASQRGGIAARTAPRRGVVAQYELVLAWFVPDDEDGRPDFEALVDPSTVGVLVPTDYYEREGRSRPRAPIPQDVNGDEPAS